MTSSVISHVFVCYICFDSVLLLYIFINTGLTVVLHQYWYYMLHYLNLLVLWFLWLQFFYAHPVVVSLKEIANTVNIALILHCKYCTFHFQCVIRSSLLYMLQRVHCLQIEGAGYMLMYYTYPLLLLCWTVGCCKWLCCNKYLLFISVSGHIFPATYSFLNLHFLNQHLKPLFIFHHIGY
jgi:hypothetical protein